MPVLIKIECINTEAAVVRKTILLSFIFLILFIYRAHADTNEPCGGGYDQLSQQEQNRHLAASNKLKKDQSEAQVQYRNEWTNCQEKFSLGNDVADFQRCTKDADNRAKISMLELGKKNVDEEKLHSDRMAELAFRCISQAGNSGDTCQDQANSAESDYRDRMFHLQMERNTIQADYRKDILDCQQKDVGRSNAVFIKTCTTAAVNKENASLLGAGQKQTQEEAVYRNHIADILTKCVECSKAMSSSDLTMRFPQQEDRAIYMNALQKSFQSCAGTHAPLAMICSLAGKRARLALQAIRASHYGCVIDEAAGAPILQKVWADLNHPVTGITAEQAGQRDGEELCKNGLLHIIDKIKVGKEEGQGGTTEQGGQCTALAGLLPQDREIYQIAGDLASGNNSPDSALEQHVKNLTGASGGYLRDLTSLWQAVSKVLKGGDVHVSQLGEVNGVAVWAPSRTQIGLVQMNGATMIVRMEQTPSGGYQLAQILGRFS